MTYVEDFLNLFPWMRNASPNILLEAFYYYIFNAGEMQFVNEFCQWEKERQIDYEANQQLKQGKEICHDLIRDCKLFLEYGFDACDKCENYYADETKSNKTDD